jgi:hypothetical protein
MKMRQFKGKAEENIGKVLTLLAKCFHYSEIIP